MLRRSLAVVDEGWSGLLKSAKAARSASHALCSAPVGDVMAAEGKALLRARQRGRASYRQGGRIAAGRAGFLAHSGPVRRQAQE